METNALDARLVRHRWDMHAIQALASGDHELLTRVFTELPLPNARDCVNTKVKTFGCGAPAQFHSYGFFDRRSAPVGGTTTLLERVEDGDTLVLIALRSCDPKSALALINVGASLHESNSAGETPIQLVFRAYATLKLRDKQQLSDPSSSQHQQTASAGISQSRVDRILAQRSEFAALCAHVQDSIDSFYGATKANSEFAPEWMPKLASQMADFEYNEQALLDSVRQKYLNQRAVHERAEVHVTTALGAIPGAQSLRK